MKTELSTKQISRISLIVYLVLFLLSFFLMCMPGGRILWYFVMGLFALPPIILGPKLYRILGIVALVLSIILCFIDYQGGKCWHKERDEAIVIPLTGCDKKEQETSVIPDQKVFRHTDFDFLFPTDWTFLEGESQPDRVVFQSTAENDQLMISIFYFVTSIPVEEAKIAFKRIVEHRRNAEKEIQPAPNLTDYQIIENDGYIYAKWGSWISSENMRGITLITPENNKVYTLFLESYGTSDEHLNKTAGLVFENFVTK